MIVVSCRILSSLLHYCHGCSGFALPPPWRCAWSLMMADNLSRYMHYYSNSSNRLSKLTAVHAFFCIRIYCSIGELRFVSFVSQESALGDQLHFFIELLSLYFIIYHSLTHAAHSSRRHRIHMHNKWISFLGLVFEWV